MQLVFPQQFSFSKTFTRVSLTREKHGTCFLFLKHEMENGDGCISLNFLATHLQIQIMTANMEVLFKINLYMHLFIYYLLFIIYYLFIYLTLPP